MKGGGSPFRWLLVPGGNLPAYQTLIREKLTPGLWNDILGRREILFIFKLADDTIRELTLSEATRAEIGQLRTALNKDPIEKASDVLRYLAAGAGGFYREAIEAFHSHGRS